MTKESNVGFRIGLVRSRSGLSQREFAERLGISPGYLSQVENGKKQPGSEVLVALRSAFDVDLNWIVGSDDGVPEPVLGDPIPVKVAALPDMKAPFKHRYNLEKAGVKVVNSRPGKGRMSPTKALAAAFSDFEAHELEMCDPVDQPDYVLDDDVPTREALLDLFCSLYAQNGPKSLGLPEWMMTVYPRLTPDDVIAALQPLEAQSEQTWVQIPAVDGSAWFAVVAELVANGVTPQQVLAKFRPNIRPNKMGDEPPEITHLMF